METIGFVIFIAVVVGLIYFMMFHSDFDPYGFPRDRDETEND